MSASDLGAVMAIENGIYTHPWTRGNFRDCLDAHYHCRVLELDAGLTGYSVVSTAAGEAHLLNLSVAADWQGGFVCPCHGSRFDLAGRVYKGSPAPVNLSVPPYRFASETQLVIGEDQAAA